MRRMPTSELRLKLSAVLDGSEPGERIAVTRDGADVAELLPPDDAAWCAAVADRFRSRRPPFTQAALDSWLADALTGADLSDLLAAPSKGDA